MNNKIIYQVDSFTDEIFKGNPAGVMILETAMDSDRMQQIANEMNLSETAFVWASGDHFEIRYFTPTIEVPLCGHATLASAHILYTQGFVNKDSVIQFKAKQDDLPIRLSEGWISMDFPRFEIEQIAVPEHLDKAVHSKISEYYVDPKNGWNLAYIETGSDLSDLKPDFGLIAKLAPELLVVTAHNLKSEFDFFVRCFVPNAGINEDPVTGAVNCILSSFWKQKLQKDSFISKQVSTRTGIIKTQVTGNRVVISGKAKTVFKAELMIET